jgi:hypothetical protein
MLITSAGSSARNIFRNHMHWSELIGGEVVISPPYAWHDLASLVRDVLIPNPDIA